MCCKHHTRYGIQPDAIGNHDITLDSDFYAQYGPYFHNQHPQDPKECQRLLDNSPSIVWLKHEAATIKLESLTGPRTTFKIFGSPLSPENGMWAFRYNAEEATQVWDKIPLDSDIVVTHTPPKYHCDETGQRRAAGCELLRNALWRVRPRLAICGHVHEGRGAERVRWDLGSSNLKYKEVNVERWEDPGWDNKKMSIVDLTSKTRTLDNDGSIGEMPIPSMANLATLRTLSTNPSLHLESTNLHITTNLLASSAEILPTASRGQGGTPPSLRCDLEALSGRLGRRETCIVNAAIMASSWPHGSGGGKKYNKPIVVDIDLPIWGE